MCILIQWCFVRFEQVSIAIRFKSWIENKYWARIHYEVICISTTQVIKWVLMKPFLRRLKEKPFLLVNFFSFEQEIPTE